MECYEVQDIHLKNITLLPEDKSTILKLNNTQQITLDNIKYPNQSSLLMNVKGKKSKNIQLLNTNISNANKGIELSIETPFDAVKH